MAVRLCSEPDCGRTHRARGLCSSHYNAAHQPDRHRKVEVECAFCGAPSMKEPGQVSKYQECFCSLRCRDDRRAEQARARRMLVPLDDPDPIGWSPLPPSHPALQIIPPPRVWVAGECRRCGRAFVDRQPETRFCSIECGRRHHHSAAKHLRRARLAGVESEPYSVQDIVSAWGSDCVVCRDPVDLLVSHGQLDSPTVEHVVAIANGGPDTLVNVRLAHAYCNSVKRDLDLSEVAC